MVSYAESSDEEDGDVFVSMSARQAGRRSRPRATLVEDDEDDYNFENDGAADVLDDGM